ncbi:MAG: hypothetical protein U5O39_04275 [Gammaproteobacteria bacterium]|nr:hypothetical protein [Gammaproteobacteria bacterium]
MLVHDGSEPAAASFDVNVEDGNEDGSAATDSGFTVTVTAVNDAPVVTVPAAQSVDEDATLNITGVSVADVDAAGGSSPEVTVSLSVTNGALTVAEGSGATVTNNGTASVTVEGTLADVNTEIGSIDYTGDTDFNGAETLTVNANDNSNTGSGGAQDDEETVSITVDAVNDVPTFTVGPDININEDDGPQTYGGFIADGSAGAANESGQTLTYDITADSAFFATDPAIDASGELTYEVAQHVSGTTTVTVALVDDGGTANGGEDTSPAQTFDIDVEAVADQPDLTTATPLTTDEDVAVNLGISAGLVDTDGGESLKVEITVPAGAEINDGVSNFSAGGTVDVSTWDLAAITVVGDSHDDTDLTLTVRATATEASNGDSDFVEEAINVTVNAVSDMPNLTLSDATTDEDTTVSLTVNGSLVDTDSSETLTYELTGVQGTLSAGMDNGGGSWTLTEAEAAGLQLTPEANSDDDFTIGVDAIAQDNAPAVAATNSGTIDVTVNAVSDAPNLTVTNNETADEDNDIALDISGSLNDTDGSETLVFELSGVQGTLSAGTDNGGGNWELTSGQLTGLTLTPIEHSDDDFTISVDAVATDGAAAPATTSDTIDVTLNAVTDIPTLNPVNVTADEDDGIALDLGGALVDQDGSETLTYELTGVKGTLSAGTDNGGGSWTLTEAQASGLTLTPIEHSDNDFVIGIDAIAQDGAAAQETVFGHVECQR